MTDRMADWLNVLWLLSRGLALVLVIIFIGYVFYVGLHEIAPWSTNWLRCSGSCPDPGDYR